MTKEDDRISNSKWGQNKKNVLNLSWIDMCMCSQPKERENANEPPSNPMILWFCYPKIS